MDAIWLCDEIQKDEMKPKFTWLTADGMTFTPESIYEQSSGMNTIGNLACSGQTEVRRYQVQTPSNPGYYMLMMSIEDGLTNTYTTRCKWLTNHQKACNLAQIHVVPSNEGIVNYDNRLVLKDANWSYEGIPAGGPLSVSIVWRGLQVIDKDYTMFLQIIGPDGQIYGQVDSWPQQGGRPTSGWRVGEEIQDAYTVYLKQDAPPGQYDVILGWYLLADMRRLPIITDSGQIMSDFYKLVTFTITAEGSIK